MRTAVVATVSVAVCFVLWAAVGCAPKSTEPGAEATAMEPPPGVVGDEAVPPPATDAGHEPPAPPRATQAAGDPNAVTLPPEATRELEAAAEQGEEEAGKTLPRLLREQADREPALGARERAEVAACQSHLKQMATAHMMYCLDYDDRGPLAESWQPGLWPYSHNESILRCPAFGDDKWGYGLSKSAAEARLPDGDFPSERFVYFETDANERSFTGGPEDLATPGRHLGGNFFSFMDGHGKWFELGKEPQDGWELE